MKKTARLHKLHKRLQRQRSHRWWSSHPMTKAARVLMWERELYEEFVSASPTDH